MKQLFKTFLVVALLLVASRGFAAEEWSIGTDKPNLRDPKVIEGGKVTYFKRCSFCHGLTGNGEGPVAQTIDPKPRSFLQPLFKFRTTASGVLPTDEDLFRTISRGITGTPMTFFAKEISKVGLTAEERWGVIAFIQTLNESWQEDDEYKTSDDPDDKEDYRYNKILVKYDDIPEPAFDAARAEKGKAVYEDKKCWECHGIEGKGNGKSFPTLKTDRGFKIHPRDFTKPWKFKGGDGIKDIFTRVTTGINGSPMPSFVDTIPEEDRWDLSHFVKSLQYERTDNEVLVVKKIEGELPVDPNDPKWSEANMTDLKLSGMVSLKPRWQNFAVDLVTVRALYNETDIAFKLEWNDRTESIKHDPKAEATQGGKTLHQSYTEKGSNGLKNVVKTYVDYYDPKVFGSDQPAKEFNLLRKYGDLRDAVALQFPARELMGTNRPHFINGDPNNPVKLWYWKADEDKAVDVEAKGIFKKFKVSKKVIESKSNKGARNSKQNWTGQWQLVFKRSLTTDNPKKDVQFVPGKFIPYAVNAWDGGNGESGTNKANSTWNMLVMEVKTPPKVYVFAAIGFMIVGLLEVVAYRKVNKNNNNS